MNRSKYLSTIFKKVFLLVKIFSFLANIAYRAVSLILNYIRAGSLHQGAATASSDPILIAAHLIAVFKRKMAVVSQKHLVNTQRLAGSSHLPLPVSL